MRLPSLTHSDSSRVISPVSQTSNPQGAARLLQATLDKIFLWASALCFCFSELKTIVVIFQKRPSRSIFFPPSHSQNFPTNLQTSAKFLGLLFDQKNSCTPHITLKAKCLNAMNILKYLSHPHTGCIRKFLLELYKSLIRSQLDYSSPIFSQTSKTPLK